MRGIQSTWAEMLHGSPLPTIVDTALPPFCGLIISDGLVTAKKVVLVGGAKKDANQHYSRVREAGGVLKAFKFRESSIKINQSSEPIPDQEDLVRMIACWCECSYRTFSKKQVLSMGLRLSTDSIYIKNRCLRTKNWITLTLHESNLAHLF